jgi:Raf kinase inhibitor-like YbhB/YbcL family protein
MFTLRSNDLTDGGTLLHAQVYNSFGHSGENISPHLAWSNAPADTKSFVVTLFDPDAPTGSGWWHWVVSNIPASVTEIPRGASLTATMPHGSLESRTDYGTPGYGGAAPPPGPPHRYIFTVYALKIPHIDVTADTSAAVVGFNCHFNSLAKATLTVTYGV